MAPKMQPFRMTNRLQCKIDVLLELLPEEKMISFPDSSFNRGKNPMGTELVPCSWYLPISSTDVSNTYTYKNAIKISN
jgi:hypothetical protein